ncbi:MAG: CPBP family intramembrane metalloprotease [Nibricoccus sp.]
MPQKLLVANLFEYALIAAGWWLLWRLQLNPAARARLKTSSIPHWAVSASNFGIAALCVVGSWLVAQIIAGLLVQQFPVLKTDKTLMTIVGGIMAQLCLIGGVAIAALFLQKAEPSATTTSESADSPALLPAALATCVVTISIVHPVQYLWEQLLTQVHLPTDKQEMVEIFFRTASPVRLFGLTAMAVVFAPVAEELVFRAGLFRFLRGRAPRLIALVLPALFFASLHVDYANLKGLVTVAPLTAFGIIFSLSYERTGRIAVPILAHAFFNLHTVLFLLLGIGE